MLNNEIPVIIINYNRLTCLKKQIESFERLNLTNITIIDHSSDYEPLLLFYENLKYPVIFLKNNDPREFWNYPIYESIKDNYYVVTDSDIIFNEYTPNDIIEKYINLLDKYNVLKVGPALILKDIPSNALNIEIFKSIEDSYYTSQIESGVYIAPIDTTFALYAPNSKFDYNPALRVGYPYDAKHYTYYLTEDNLSEEDLHYINSANSLSSSSDQIKKKGILDVDSNTFFKNKVLISLDNAKYKERNTKFFQQTKKLGFTNIKTIGFDYDFLSPFYTERLNYSVPFFTENFSTSERFKKMFAVSLSHAYALKRAIDEKWDNILVFENDAIFYKDTKNILNKALNDLPKDWEVFYPGCVVQVGRIEKMGRVTKYNTPRIVLGQSYAINSKAFEKVYNTYMNFLFTGVLYIFDMFLGWSDINNLNLNYYGVLPHLTTQANYNDVELNINEYTKGKRINEINFYQQPHLYYPEADYFKLLED